MVCSLLLLAGAVIPAALLLSGKKQARWNVGGARGVLILSAVCLGAEVPLSAVLHFFQNQFAAFQGGSTMLAAYSVLSQPLGWSLLFQQAAVFSPSLPLW